MRVVVVFLGVVACGIFSKAFLKDISSAKKEEICSTQFKVDAELFGILNP